MRLFRAVVGLVVAGVTATALADDVKDLLKKCDEATKAVKGVTYDSEVFFEGKDADTAPRGKATVRASKISDDNYKLYVEGTINPPQGDPRKVLVGTDGKVSIAVDHAKKTYTKSESEGDKAMILGQGVRFHMLEYTHPTPFQDEVNADEAKHEGTKTIAGVECDVIYVKYAGGMGESRWYFGKKDHLPRRVDRISEEGSNVIVVSNLKVNPTFEADAFTPAKPAGYEEKKFERPTRAAAPELLKVGSEAPAWTLKTPDGKDVSLASLKGKVVVLDFWAVWCGPCKKAMPGVQKLHEKYKDKGVVIYGVNTWEREGNDPVAFMKDNNYSYGLLLKGDDVAKDYKVSGIPTFYVIDRNGKISYVGVGAGDESALEKAIEAALGDKSG